jgi:hypothetical protein
MLSQLLRKSQANTTNNKNIKHTNIKIKNKYNRKL